MNLKINSKRLHEDFDNLAEIGATVAGGVTRLALSNDDLAARAWFADCIEEAGLAVRDDEVGNLSGLLLSKNKQAKTLMIGSHLDTVPNGGRYDGAIGVLTALECLRTIKNAEIELPVHLEAINFTDEEGTWKSFFGSLGLAGRLQPDDINDSLQDNGAFRAALFRAGILPTEVHRAQRDPQSLLGYLEYHIEQSDKLDKAQLELGLVTGIVGRTTYNLTFYGEAAHAGTTIAESRRDALQGAAAFIILIHNLINQEYEGGVVNCGNVQVKPGAFNVVPSEASLRVECRHPDAKILGEMESRLVRLAQDCAKDYRLSVTADRTLHREAEQMSPQWLGVMEQICQQANISYTRLVSYAGHDAQIMNAITPSAMLFVPSVDGVSHNPREYTDWNTIVKGANVLLNTILQIAEKH